MQIFNAASAFSTAQNCSNNRVLRYPEKREITKITVLTAWGECVIPENRDFGYNTAALYFNTHRFCFFVGIA